MLENQQLQSAFAELQNYNCPDCLIYNSIDVRQSPFKSAPVDNNIFPAGFNNISRESCGVFSKTLQTFFIQKDIKTVLIVTEDHTRNEGYLQNVLFLYEAVASAGMKVEIATLSLDKHTITRGDVNIQISKLYVENSKLVTDSMPNPDLILLNNDLSGQILGSEKLDAMLQSSNILPSPHLGWNKRRKSSHFIAYSKIAKQLAEKTGFDPWLIDAQFSTAQCLDFSSTVELQNLADVASDLFIKIKQKYKEYKIPTRPEIFLKSESGTYGLGVEKVTNPEDLLNPNRTFRKKILYNKSKIANTQFLLQEAVPTQITQSGKTAECTFYTIFGKPFGGFYRIHGGKNNTDNLNSRGAEFMPLELEKAQENSIATLIARLSTIAVSQEVNP